MKSTSNLDLKTKLQNFTLGEGHFFIMRFQKDTDAPKIHICNKRDYFHKKFYITKMFMVCSPKWKRYVISATCEICTKSVFKLSQNLVDSKFKA